MGAVTAKILEGADAYDARSSFDPEERKKWMNASEAMSCLRRQYYDKTGAEKDGPEDWGYARRGSHGEIYLVERLRLANIHVVHGGEDQVSLQDPDTRISATPDGFIWGPSIGAAKGWVAVEFKTIDPRTNISNLPKKNHVVQVQLAAALGTKLQVPDAYPVIGCKLIYMNCSNYNTIYEFDVPVKNHVLDLMASRAERLFKVTSPRKLTREGELTPKKQDCKLCPFSKVCGVDGVESTAPTPHTGLVAARNQYMYARADIDAAEVRKRTAAEEIKAALHADDVTSMAIGEGGAKLSKRSGRVDYQRILDDHGIEVDLDEYRADPVETLTVK